MTRKPAVIPPAPKASLPAENAQAAQPNASAVSTLTKTKWTALSDIFNQVAARFWAAVALCRYFHGGQSCQSARGLAHSRTLARFCPRCENFSIRVYSCSSAVKSFFYCSVIDCAMRHVLHRVNRQPHQSGEEKGREREQGINQLLLGEQVHEKTRDEKGVNARDD